MRNSKALNIAIYLLLTLQIFPSTYIPLDFLRYDLRYSNPLTTESHIKNFEKFAKNSNYTIRNVKQNFILPDKDLDKKNNILDSRTKDYK